MTEIEEIAKRPIVGQIVESFDIDFNPLSNVKFNDSPKPFINVSQNELPSMDPHLVDDIYVENSPKNELEQNNIEVKKEELPPNELQVPPPK